MSLREEFANRRAISLLVLLCLTVLGQWCALTAEDLQHGPHEHCCLLCHIGPHATLDAVTPVVGAPVLTTAWVAQTSDPVSHYDTPVSRRSSRAPPADSRS